MKHFSIAIDGPAGAGKSTVAKIIADKLNINYIDTGAMYRAFTLKLISKNINLDDLECIIHTLNNTSIDFKDNHIFLDGVIVDEEIRDNNISNNVSKIATIKQVRERLVELQRDIAKNSSSIMDGRDIGSTVLKNAEYKFFLTASVEERAHRRHIDLGVDNPDFSLESVKKDIEARDKIDTTREISPLIQSEDAIVIDTTGECIEETVERILKTIKELNR